ncbi:MAG: hypothetical protein E7058_10305 [Lentisphaerae bacterium]|nr:hypothetical protein [Lentisphaerota bacterium]
MQANHVLNASGEKSFFHFLKKADSAFNSIPQASGSHGGADDALISQLFAGEHPDDLPPILGCRRF